MKATLEFDLPDDQSQFQFACNGEKWFTAMWNLDQWLRSQIKYNDHNMTEEEFSAYEKCREKLYDVMNYQGINFNE